MRRLPRLAIATAVVAVAGIVVAVALAAEPAIKTFTPRSERQITNIDVLRQQIRNYYGDPLGTGNFGADSNYAKEAEFVAKIGGVWLKANAHLHRRSQNKAIVLDVDDTTLATWNYEVFSNWAYTFDSNQVFVLEQRFPAVPGMVEMVNQAAAEGYAIFFLTGRGQAQEAATLGNLTSDGIGLDAGYPSPTTLNNGEDGLFTKPAVADYPDYLKEACADDIAAGHSCSTIHYKSATRAHIESLGYEIVGNFGDQFSDLEGGHADKTFKLPNPNYFLP
jgi:predicted secreted acid phosphatase